MTAREPTLSCGSLLQGGSRLLRLLLRARRRRKWVGPSFSPVAASFSTWGLERTRRRRFASALWTEASPRRSWPVCPVSGTLRPAAAGLAHFSVSRTGVLAFRGGEAGGGQLVWTNPDGKIDRSEGDPADIFDTSLSPDGRWLAMGVDTG